MPQINTLNIENTTLPPKTTSLTGQIGENLATQFLIRRGYRIICSNFKVPIGRNARNATVTGEIDIIALDKDILCFIEVKTRSSDDFASPLAAIDLRKQRQIIRTAKVYRKIFDINDIKRRYDAVSIVTDERKHPKIELFKNFWNESRFNKKLWRDEIW